jgi:integrase
MPRGRTNQGPKLVLLKKKGWLQSIYYIRYTEGGRSRELTTGTGDRGEPEKIFGQWLLDRTAAAPATSGPRYPAETPVADVLALFAEHHAPDLVAPERIGYAVTRLCEWWADRCLDAVRPETCRQYRHARLKAGVTEATASKELSVLRAAGNWGVKNGYLLSAPFVELPPRQPGKDRWLSRNEVARLLWESRRHGKSRLHLPLFILIAVNTGDRRGAILGLKWSQVDLVKGRIDFNEPGRRRTNKQRPIIPIPRGLRWFLAKAHTRANSPYVIAYDGEQLKAIRRSFGGAC